MIHKTQFGLHLFKIYLFAKIFATDVIAQAVEVGLDWIHKNGPVQR